eukprot:6187101-Pleurochrysis_carterae.AAC.1
MEETRHHAQYEEPAAEENMPQECETQMGNDGSHNSDGVYSDGSDDESRDVKRATPEYEHDGAAGYSSSLRTWDANAERKRAALTRNKRPSHQAYSDTKLTPEAVQAVITGRHRCRNKWFDGVANVPCPRQLWAHLSSDAIVALTRQREQFLALSNRERAKAVCNSLVLESHVGPLHNDAAQSSWRRPMQRVFMRVGPSPDKVREVCKQVFREHHPYSLASLKRRMQEKQIGCEPGKFGTNRRDKSEVNFRTTKSLH